MAGKLWEMAVLSGQWTWGDDLPKSQEWLPVSKANSQRLMENNAFIVIRTKGKYSRFRKVVEDEASDLTLWQNSGMEKLLLRQVKDNFMWCVHADHNPEASFKERAAEADLITRQQQVILVSSVTGGLLSQVLTFVWGLLRSKAMAAVQWEFCRGVRPTGDGVSLVEQAWQPVTNYEMILGLDNGREDDGFWYEGQAWHCLTADSFEMRLYQSLTNPANNIIVRPRRRYNIILEVYASIIRGTTWVRFQARYKATNNVAADIRIHGVDGISFYELQWYLRDSIKPPEDAALQIMSTAHDERVLSVFDCMLYVRGSSQPNYKPRYRILEKTEPGECRLREFFLPVTD
ncbi:unnamed protein product [Symbiodinium sp. CCMP2592]|nr:unnamed protein product [Symbiodinium sp. CCMP2592]